MVEGNGGPTLGELARSQARIEITLARMETQQEERHDVVLKQVSDVRHRVANLEAERTLSKEFFQRVGALFDRVEQLEKHEIAETAVGEFKKELLSMKWIAGVLSVVLIGLQIWQAISG